MADLQRAVTFFEALGFAFNPHFTDASATCMLVGEDAYFMLLDRERFTGFSKRPLGDPRRETNAMFALSVNARDEVDAMVDRAVAAGGSCARLRHVGGGRALRKHTMTLSRCRSGRTQAGHRAPRCGALAHGRPVLSSRKQMAPRAEQIAHARERIEEPLGPTPRTGSAA